MSDDDGNWNRLREAIAQRIDQAGTSQRAVSLAADLDENTVGNLLLGRVRSRPRTLRRIARALGWDEDVPERILRGDDPPLPAPRSSGVDITPRVQRDRPRDDDTNWAETVPVDFVSAAYATPEQLLKLIESEALPMQQIAEIAEVAVAKTLDAHVAESGWEVEGVRPDSGADLALADEEGRQRVLIEVRLPGRRGLAPVDAAIGRAVRLRGQVARRRGTLIDVWVLFTSDPGPQAVEAFEDAGVTMGWIGNLPPLPSS